jgi:hypothetical protein
MAGAASRFRGGGQFPNRCDYAMARG